jgi:uncharacterized protein (TIGR03086 family)
VSPSPVDLLERSIDYALVGIAAVEPSMLHRQTPCSEWDLHDLLFHLADSMLTLGELLGGAVGEVSGCGPAAKAAAAARDLRRTLASIGADAITSMGTIEELPIPQHLVVLTGALEIAIHGWDIAQACRHPNPIPAQVAHGLLPRAPLLLDSTIRRDLFAAPIEPTPGATAADRLVAYAGRRR